MISFEDSDGVVILVYESEFGGPGWVTEKLASDGQITLSRTFTLTADRLVSQDDEYLETSRFQVGSILAEYRSIDADVLGLEHDLLVVKTLALKRSIFVAQRNISIFASIDRLAGGKQQIVIGGSREDSIPDIEFLRLVHQFPTSTELTHYAAARIARIIREYFEFMPDAESKLQRNIRRREAIELGSGPVGPDVLAATLELEKFEVVRDRLAEMLADAEGYSESQWQRGVLRLFLLIFPQYIAVLENVRVRERYSKPSRWTDRYIDLMLVAANGSIDLIEVKKPFERSLVSRTRYRDNHIPMRELSGSIMQAEKYLFYLNKSGREGELALTAQYGDQLPEGLQLRITNPKAYILSGRDSNLVDQEVFDLEIVRRQFSNVVDVISYDDLLRRIGNVINALSGRLE